MSRRPYIDLWFVLAIALMVIVGISLAEKDLHLGTYTLKRAPFREQLLAKPTPPEPSKNSEASLPSEPSEIDPKPQTFLIFGDSMTPNLARRLADYAGYNGHSSVHSVSWDSSTSISWAESNRIEEFIAKYKPTFIFVCLGSNESYLKNPSVRSAKIQSIINKFGDIPYVWIGPPRFGEQNAYNDMLASLLGEQHFFRSDGLDLQRGDDNIHPVQSGANQWMDAVMSWLPRSAHPFFASTPAQDAVRARLTFDFFGSPRKSLSNISEPSDSSDISNIPESPDISESPATPVELPDSCAQ